MKEPDAETKAPNAAPADSEATPHSAEISAEEDSSFAELLREIARVEAPTTAPLENVLSGTTRFVLRKLLGQGGFGAVYEAYDAERGASVALKLLRTPDPLWLARFKREFRDFAGIHHVHLVALHELIAAGDAWFFTMELVHGRPLVAKLREARGAPDYDARVRRAFGSLASGVGALHEAGKLHCDLKPSNVLMTVEDRVVILDFGLAVDLTSAGPVSMRASFGVEGTPAYMAPEQAAGRRPTTASDWYAVGVMLFETLTGELPLRGSTAELLQDKQNLEAADPRALCPELPDDLADLCVALTRRDPSQRPSEEIIRAWLRTPGRDDHAQTPRRSPTWGPPMLVGRERELEALRGALADAERQRCTVVCVHGASGLGKSALVHRFLEGVRDVRPGLVLEGRCYELESVPYKALDGIVDQLAARLTRLDDATCSRLLPRDIARASHLFPALRQVRAIGRAGRRATTETSQQRAHGIAALRALLHNMAGGAPVVLAVDDLQWADPESGSMLLELLTPDAETNVLFIGSYRPEGEASAAVKALWTLPHVRDITVLPLAEDEARTLAEVLVAGVPRADAARIAAESEGSPLFLQELARAAREGSSGGGISLTEMLARRIAKLPPDARRLLDAVAIAGQPTRLDVLENVAGLAGYEAFAAAGLLRAGSLLRTAGPHPEDRAETFHDRIREEVLRHLAPVERAVLHGRIASALERTGDADAETLAVHWAGAGDRARAGLFAERAGDAAASALAFDHAVRLFAWAIELAGGDEHARPALAALHEKHADALANAGWHEDAAVAYLAAASNVYGSAPRRFTRRAAEQLLRAGAVAEGRRLLLQVVAPDPVTPSEAPPAMPAGLADGELDGAPVSRTDKVRALREAPLFAGLLPEQLDVVAAIADVVRFTPGQCVVQEGTPGDALFLVVDGLAEVTKRAAHVRNLDRGDVLGEVAALDGSPRSASVTALTDLTLLRIRREELDILLDTYPELARGVIRTLLAYLR